MVVSELKDRTSNIKIIHTMTLGRAGTCLRKAEIFNRALGSEIIGIIQAGRHITIEGVRDTSAGVKVVEDCTRGETGNVCRLSRHRI